MGTRLCKAKKVNKGLKGLPDWMVDKLQNYFGIALWVRTLGPVFFMLPVVRETISIRCVKKGQQVGASTNATRQTRQTCITHAMVCLKKSLR